MPRPNPLEILKQASFAQFLTDSQLNNLLLGGKQILLKPNEVLFEEGSSGSTMYFVLDGKVEIYRKNRSIAMRTSGDYLGEMALLESKPRSASVRAVTHSLVLEINVDHFNSYIAANPKIVWELVKTLSKRSRDELDIVDLGFEKLKKSEELYRNIVQSVSDIILQISANGAIEFANNSVRSLGYEPYEMIGQPVEKFLDLDVQEVDWLKILTKRIGARMTVDYEVNFKANEGSNLFQIVRSAPYLINASGMWNVSNEAAIKKGIEKEFLGTLWVARSEKLNIRM